MKKIKRVLEIASELDKLGYPGVAQMLRDAVTSKEKQTNEQSNEEEPPPSGGSNPPENKPKPDKP